MGLEEITRFLERDLLRVKNIMAGCLEREPGEIRESFEKGFFSGGKFLRPLLALLCAGAAAQKKLGPESAGETAVLCAALEFLHDASLVHDDIMDGDLMRRNLVTLHARYGQTCAVLLGDILYVMVFELLSRLRNPHAMNLMIQTIRDLCYGQLLDLKREARTPQSYEKMIRYKTGALMATACEGGVLMSREAGFASSLENVRKFGMQVGILYQMADDYMDGDAGVPLFPEMILEAGLKAKRLLLDIFEESEYRRHLEVFVDSISVTRDPDMKTKEAKAESGSYKNDG